MMLYPSIMELMEKAGNRYSLVIAASKRARTILEENKGEDGNLDGARSITKAVEEIAGGDMVVVNETIEQQKEREAEEKAKADAKEEAEKADYSAEAEDEEAQAE